MLGIQGSYDGVYLSYSHGRQVERFYALYNRVIGKVSDLRPKCPVKYKIFAVTTHYLFKYVCETRGDRVKDRTYGEVAGNKFSNARF